MMSFAMVTFFPWSIINDVLFIQIPNIFRVAQTHVLAIIFVLCFCIKYFVKKFLYLRLNVQRFFYRYSGVLGLPAIFPPCFQHIRPANVFRVCYMICLAMNQHRFMLIFYGNFRFPKCQSHLDYLYQKSIHVVTFGNAVPIVSLQYPIFYAFVPVGKLIM